jgi:hypothetical protein
MSGKFCPPTYKVDLPFLLSASSLRRFDGPTEPEIMGIRLGLDICVCIHVRDSRGAGNTEIPPRACATKVLPFARAGVSVESQSVTKPARMLPNTCMLLLHVHITPSPCVACLMDASRQCALPPSLACTVTLVSAPRLPHGAACHLDPYASYALPCVRGGVPRVDFHAIIIIIRSCPSLSSSFAPA